MDNDALLKQLQQEVKGLLYTSESDAPVDAFVWKHSEVGADTLTPDAVQKFKKIATGQKASESSVSDFFAPLTTAQSWYGDDEKATMQKYQQLVETLQTNLTDLHVYTYGDKKQDIYVVGKTASGDFAGVHTKAVET